MVRNKRFLIKTVLVISIGFSVPVGMAQTPDESIHQAETAIRQRDYVGAAEILSRASLSESAKAYYLLATLYRSGRGVQKNDKKAFGFMYSAAELELVEAQYSLGKLFLSGRGTDVNREEGVKWVARAAEAGHPKATILLAKLIQADHAKKRTSVQQETDNKISQSEIHKIQKSDISEKHGWTVLMEVARRGQIKMLKQLISANVQLDVQDQQGRTAIMHAAQTGAQNTLALLVEAGAKTGIQDRNGNTAVAYAANADNVSGLKLLLSVSPHSSIVDASVLELL
ncbi:MAG: ankyrin repeat domain-containing protein, partial [Amylibacter sp.]